MRYGPDLRVLVVGAGIAGVGLTALLQQRGFSHVQLVEKATSFKKVGYVISLWPAGSKILGGLRLYPALLEVGEPYHKEVKVSQSGRLLKEISHAPIVDKYGPLIGVYRADLVEILLRAVAPDSVRLGTTVRHWQERPDGVWVGFSDGREEVFDVLVACDGIHSPTRQQLFPTAAPRHSGSGGWACWVPPRPDLKGYYLEMNSPDWRYFGLYPARDRLCLFMGVPQSADYQDTEHVAKIRETFADFGGIVPDVLAHLDQASDVMHIRYLDLALDSLAQGRVALAGDAGHAVLPSAGFGGSLALESAAVLSDELSRANSATVAEALQRYSARRLPRTRALLSSSAFTTTPEPIDIDTMIEQATVETILGQMQALLAAPV